MFLDMATMSAFAILKLILLTRRINIFDDKSFPVNLPFLQKIYFK